MFVSILDKIKEGHKNHSDDLFSYYSIVAIVASAFIFPIFAIGRFIVEFHKFEISNKMDDWSSFGSFISGVFSPAAGVAVIVTIFIFEKQFNQSKKEKIPENYTRHKKEFFEVLKSCEESLDNKFKFNSQLELYSRFFPEYTMSNMPGKRVLKNGGDSYRGELERVIVTYNDIIETLKYSQKHPNDIRCINNIVHDINSIVYDLNLKARTHTKNGDLYLFGQPTPLNIFTIGEDIHALYKIITRIITYTGNSTSIVKENTYRYLLTDILIKSQSIDRKKFLFAFHVNMEPSANIILKSYAFSMEHRNEVSDIYNYLSEEIKDLHVHEEYRNKKTAGKIFSLYKKISNEDIKNSMLEYVS